MERSSNKRSKTKDGVPAFLTKTFEIVSSANYKCVCWNSRGDALLVRDVQEFQQNVLPKYFKHNNFQSFVRQLNMYSFHKTKHDSSWREFQHVYFRKGRRDLLALIKRKTNQTTNSTRSQSPTISVDKTDSQSKVMKNGGNTLSHPSISASDKRKSPLDTSLIATIPPTTLNSNGNMSQNMSHHISSTPQHESSSGSSIDHDNDTDQSRATVAPHEYTTRSTKHLNTTKHSYTSSNVHDDHEDDRLAIEADREIQAQIASGVEIDSDDESYDDSYDSTKETVQTKHTNGKRNDTYSNSIRSNSSRSRSTYRVKRGRRPIPMPDEDDIPTGVLSHLLQEISSLRSRQLHLEREMKEMRQHMNDHSTTRQRRVIGMDYELTPRALKFSIKPSRQHNKQDQFEEEESSDMNRHYRTKNSKFMDSNGTERKNGCEEAVEFSYADLFQSNDHSFQYYYKTSRLKSSTSSKYELSLYEPDKYVTSHGGVYVRNRTSSSGFDVYSFDSFDVDGSRVMHSLKRARYDTNNSGSSYTSAIENYAGPSMHTNNGSNKNKSVIQKNSNDLIPSVQSDCLFDCRGLSFAQSTISGMRAPSDTSTSMLNGETSHIPVSPDIDVTSSPSMTALFSACESMRAEVQALPKPEKPIAMKRSSNSTVHSTNITTPTTMSHTLTISTPTEPSGTQSSTVQHMTPASVFSQPSLLANSPFALPDAATTSTQINDEGKNSSICHATQA